MSLRQQSATLLAPVVLIVGAALIGSLFARPTEIYFINAFVATTVVVALYIFVGNGVVSFGHISFVAVGAWAAGVLSVPVAEKASSTRISSRSSPRRRSETCPRWSSPRSSAARTRSSSACR